MKYFMVLSCFVILAAFTFVPTTETESFNSLTLSASNKSAAKGSEVCLDVTTKGFQQILSMQYSMKWSSKVLKFKSLKGFSLPGLTENNFGTNNSQKGILTFSWYDFNVRGITVPDGTSLYQVCFDVIGESGSKGYFQFTDYPTTIEIANSQSHFLNLNGMNGAIKVR